MKSHDNQKYSIIAHSNTIEMCVLCAVVNYTPSGKTNVAMIDNSGVDAFFVTQYLVSRGILIDTKTIFETLFELYLKKIILQLRNTETGEILYKATEKALKQLSTEITKENYVLISI